jgi:integration host factor subunit beta
VIKSELIIRLAGQNPHLIQQDVEKVIATILVEIESALARGNRVELRGFGTFSVKRRRGRVARNPRTGTTVQVPEKAFVLFRPGTR